MKKNLLDKSGTDNILTRIKALKPATSAVWGSMTPARMLRHCNDITASVLEGSGSNKPSSLKQRILKILVLYVRPQLPKDIKGPKRFTEYPDEPGIDFDLEMERYKSLAQRFSSHSAEIRLAHPFLGRLNTRQWGRFVWMHLDHHLRQFGA